MTVNSKERRKKGKKKEKYGPVYLMNKVTEIFNKRLAN